MKLNASPMLAGTTADTYATPKQQYHLQYQQMLSNGNSSGVGGRRTPADKHQHWQTEATGATHNNNTAPRYVAPSPFIYSKDAGGSDGQE